MGRFWKMRFHILSIACSGWAAATGLFPMCRGNHAATNTMGKSPMLRKSLLAIAASVMTVSTFGGTMAILSGGSPVASQAA